MLISVEPKSSSKSLLLAPPVVPDARPGPGAGVEDEVRQLRLVRVRERNRRLGGRWSRYEGSDGDVILQETLHQEVQEAERRQGGSE